MKIIKIISTVIVICFVLSANADVVSWHNDHRSTPKLCLLNPSQNKVQSNPEQSAFDYLSNNFKKFDLPSNLSNLKLELVKESLLGKHFHFRQFLNNIPVDKAEIIVSVNKNGAVYMVFNNTFPQKVPIKINKKISTENAVDIAWNLLRVHGKLFSIPKADLVYMPDGENFRLVYKSQINVQAPFGYWDVRIDASTEEVLSVSDTVIYRVKKNKVDNKNDFYLYKGKIFDKNIEIEKFLENQKLDDEKMLLQAKSKKAANGSADVFDPDPRTTLQDASLVDSSSAASFNSAYLNRNLLDITENAGTYSLVGPWVRIVDFDIPNTAPSTTTDGNWTAKRGNNAFNDAMTYFHIDQNQRYIQSLGFTGSKSIQAVSIEVDSDAANGDDNSYFSPMNNQLAFGHGGVDDNEDADVILHEYGHAIQYDINNSWNGGDTGAMGEGFGDYWAGSYSYSTPNGVSFHPEWIFSWDGHNSFWAGRLMNLTTLQYDPTKSYPAHANIGGVSGDELWSTPLFQAFRDLRNLGYSRDEMDKIILQAHFGLGANVTMREMANTIINTANSLYPSGQHRQVYYSNFLRHNIVEEKTFLSPNDDFSSSGEIGGPFTPASKIYTIENSSGANLTWTANCPSNWITLSSANGNVAAGSSENVTVSINANANNLSVGEYNSFVIFNNTVSGEQVTRNVILKILPPTIYEFLMDTNPGWTTEGQWEFGVPLGGGSENGDPTSGYSGNNVYGYNLSGNYNNNIPETFLTTTALDFSSYRDVQIIFQRWLGVEDATYDHAKIQVSNNGSSWETIWEHTGSSNISDDSWQEIMLDISMVADRQSTVFVRWVMGASDGTLTFPGWNIDDVIFVGKTIPEPGFIAFIFSAFFVLRKKW